MRILLDVTFARRGMTGTGIYLEKISEALSALGVEVVEADNENRRPPAAGGPGSLLNFAADRAWIERGLPRLAREAGAELIHHPLPAAGLFAGLPQVVTVHDLAFVRLPWAFDVRYRLWAGQAHRAAVHRAAAVVCVSQTTALDVRARWGVDPARIVVARHGPGQELPLVARGEPRHFLYIGDDEPRKNLGTLLAGYARYRERVDEPLALVLAGSAYAVGPGVELVTRPEAERLAELHAHAAALVHVALHEGFGFTPLEAMMAGTPVICGRSPGLIETCGDAVRYVDPRDPESIAAALVAVAADPAIGRDLTERGRRRGAERSWTRSARDHVRAYELALEAPG